MNYIRAFLCSYLKQSLFNAPQKHFPPTAGITTAGGSLLWTKEDADYRSDHHLAAHQGLY